MCQCSKHRICPRGIGHNVGAYCVWLILKTNLSHVDESNKEIETPLHAKPAKWNMHSVVGPLFAWSIPRADPARQARSITCTSSLYRILKIRWNAPVRGWALKPNFKYSELSSFQNQQTMADSRVTQGSFTPAFSRNRTWKSPFICLRRSFSIGATALPVWSQMYFYITDIPTSLVVISFQIKWSSHFWLSLDLKPNRLSPSLHCLSATSSLLQLSPSLLPHVILTCPMVFFNSPGW